ncbi:MAG: endonuclease MutS2 [Bacillota bacterium]
MITDREIKVLEFDTIRQSLASLATSPMARQMAAQLIPSADYGLIEKQQRETSEGRLLFSKNAFTPSAVEDIKQYLSRADKGSLLSGSELAAIMAFIKASRRWSAFFKDNDNRLLYPLLADLAMQIRSCQELGSTLERSLDQDGNILDNASPVLSSIRRKKLSFQNKIRDKLDEYMRSANYRRYLQDPLVTIRGGRYVLPVKQEYRQHVAGVVHDQSSSGATLFIEPLPVVQMQNELTTTQRREEEEIERVLFTLSGQVATAGVDLAQNRSLYAELDYIVARGRYSYETGSTEPVLLSEEKPIIQLTHAIHPLLSGEKIPLTVELGEEAQTLVITGPNTGGKTVALKTIGLMAVMAQSGLHLPAGKETKVSVFTEIRADIGDEQSIAQSLSTFSGHMKNIIEIIAESSPGALVLLDELGAGTDPSEGSALAMAILEELTYKGALTIATTHINELKLFAQVQEKMQNAAMEFDPDTLAPTYRLLQGVPGQSNAFYIAEELGLPYQVLKKAKSFVHRSHDQVETVIASLVQDQQRLHRDSRQAAFDRSRAEVLMEELEKERELLRARRDDVLQEAREEARKIIKGVKYTADQLMKELRELKNTNIENPQARAEELRRDLNLIQKDIESDEDEAESELSCLTSDDLAVGQIVYISSLKQRGEIVTFSAEEALVQVGSMKVHLPLRELKQDHKKNADIPGKEKKIEKRGYSVQKDLAISNSIDLRGLNLDEARPLVDKLLDNALWAGLNKVDLIHGKGTGKLKLGLRDYLKEHPLVSAFRSGSSAEGGEGVTVVEIKS